MNVIEIDNEKLIISSAPVTHGVKTVIVTYTGSDSWGISIVIPESELSSLINNKDSLREFLSFARQKIATNEKEILSQREIDIIRLLERRKTNKQLAQELFISVNTVKCHLYKIYRKIGVRNRTELIAYTSGNLDSI
ncbi:helix-turn-helix transcriptional regulator [Vibrio rhizosphaerae]|uniref:Helix-turn-helix transcriptional regulator n=1 Tax=Vibrio rhizosphaerae TaxID=398736 RepID=A0ABU4IXD8_9VIBR|nr:helix-turn-helix transcriptional regulator [Vibrio rhizosphaerae]MDW6094015.1 helix-turn-helix transcriptional regulator [Vibrio rhizosphaerae]